MRPSLCRPLLLQQAHFPTIAVLRWHSPRCPLCGAARGSWISRQHDSDTERRKLRFGSSGIRTAATSGCLTSAVSNKQNGVLRTPISKGNCVVTTIVKRWVATCWSGDMALRTWGFGDSMVVFPTGSCKKIISEVIYVLKRME